MPGYNTDNQLKMLVHRPGQRCESFVSSKTVEKVVPEAGIVRVEWAWELVHHCLAHFLVEGGFFRTISFFAIFLNRFSFLGVHKF